jgi:ABC-type oligopeptide transport system substrate-binding subunit
MIPRRALLGIGSAALVSCARSESAYFGSTDAPRVDRLVHTLAGEIESLDPAKSTGSNEFYVVPAVFEGLTQYHPELPIPMAALATHYEANADCTQYRFYLRGHASPRGVRLPDVVDLPEKFTRHQTASADPVPARWSDGRQITAQDFVYSWRRFVDPQTAAPLAYQFVLLRNAEEVIAGRLPPSQLGVSAPDKFTFVVDLRSSTSFFLEFVTSYVFAPVPPHVVEAARTRGAESTWTEPAHIVTSGPFMVRQYRRYDKIVLVRNPQYYDAASVRLQELTFVPVVDGTTTINLYKAGHASVTPGLSLPPLFTPVLSRKKDYHSIAGFGTVSPCLSTRRTPFDNVFLRYALNMATRKQVLTDFLGPGYAPARSLVAPLPDYPQPDSLDIDVDGKHYDVLTFNVEGARALLAKAGYPGGIRQNRRTLEVPFHFPALPESKPKAEIIQQQWRDHLNIDVKLLVHEFNVHWSMVLNADFTGVADFGTLPLYLDPNGFLDQFAATSGVNPAAWSDAVYNSELHSANSVLNRTERLQKLAACERRLLAGMPFLPFYNGGLSYLCKPYVRGLASTVFDTRALKYAWIDTNWRPE